jgi:hAT family C-terminal dimerisation region
MICVPISYNLWMARYTGLCSFIYLLVHSDFDSNPFVWWYERREKFPILSYLAKKYLTVLACSTASERLFSDAGNLLTAKRSRMCPKLFRKLMFLKRNGKYLDSIHKS